MKITFEAIALRLCLFVSDYGLRVGIQVWVAICRCCGCHYGVVHIIYGEDHRVEVHVSKWVKRLRVGLNFGNKRMQRITKLPQ